MQHKTQHMAAQEYTATQHDAGMRLDRLCHKVFALPNTLCQKFCRKGLIRINGKRCQASDRVENGDVIHVKTTFAASQKPLQQKQGKPVSAAQQKKLQSYVLYRDADIIVLNKPSGLAVQGGSKLSEHLDGMLSALQFDAQEPPRLVHRLDKDTSGLLLLARHVQAARVLQQLFASRALHKTYLAVVAGVPQPQKGVIESTMEKRMTSEDDMEKMQQTASGKWAKTEYEVLDYMAKTAALVALHPITGRTHQLRVHMAEIGCPILAERKYATRTQMQPFQMENNTPLHLHAWEIDLPACFGKKARQFMAPLPAAMQQSMARFGLEIRK